MQSEKTRKLLSAETKLNDSRTRAFALFVWDGDKISLVEYAEVVNDANLERFALAVAKEGNNWLRRILKHRLEKRRNVRD